MLYIIITYTLTPTLMKCVPVILFHVFHATNYTFYKSMQHCSFVQIGHMLYIIITYTLTPTLMKCVPVILFHVFHATNYTFYKSMQHCSFVQIGRLQAHYLASFFIAALTSCITKSTAYYVKKVKILRQRTCDDVVHLDQ